MVEHLGTVHRHRLRLEAIVRVMFVLRVLTRHLQTVELYSILLVILIRVIHVGEPLRAAQHGSNGSNHALTVDALSGCLKRVRLSDGLRHTINLGLLDLLLLLSYRPTGFETELRHNVVVEQGLYDLGDSEVAAVIRV